MEATAADGPDGGPQGPDHTVYFSWRSRSWSVTSSNASIVWLLSSLYGPMQDHAPSGDHLELRIELDPVASCGLLGVGPSEPIRLTRPARLLAKLVWTINRHVIDAPHDGELPLHAGAVADAQGAAAILPGLSEAGKTTLTAGLLRNGLGYMTDEAVRITGDLEVDGYRKPLSIDRGSWSLFPELAPSLPAGLGALMNDQWQVPASAVSFTVSTASAAVIVLPCYQPGARTSVRRLPAIDALDQLRSCVFSTDRTGQQERIPTARIRQLAALVERVPSYQLISGDLESSCEAVQCLLEDASG